ncbi:hypothetical protein [Brachybacterium saurashtrense]|uniref:Uncharacterized protein n=1 Tax=Brachybacterium saurashtrense TaxID=556288 RepID=A0A345YJU7_9MICO|nr:hypothetical protein [Brachybacterium saurashtrense]AXK44199.1 hypothetical protein DWV08_00200 [Brachybacterium saurashtrense]RRR21471.1 hypothetical protein DXU92_14100 [Brachybacterium saurashtrense]
MSGETEAKRRVELFRALLESDVALLLVDGQKLLDHAGAEERYLGSLFGSLSNLFSVMRDDILDDGQKLVQFPRVWIIALSKADLLPEMTAKSFMELVTRETGEHLIELRDVLAGYVIGDEALAVGEDAVVLSSAKFEPGRIDLEARVGVDLMLPLAAVLPVERHLRWAGKKEIPAKVAKALVRNSQEVLGILTAGLDVAEKLPIPPQVKLVAEKVAKVLSSGLASDFLGWTEQSIEDAHRKAVEANDEVRAILTGFMLDLRKAEQDGVLLRGDR